MGADNTGATPKRKLPDVKGAFFRRDPLAEVTVVAIAAATRPKATVDSALAAISDNCDRSSKYFGKEVGVRGEIERGLKLTRRLPGAVEAHEGLGGGDGAGLTFAALGWNLRIRSVSAKSGQESPAAS